MMIRTFFRHVADSFKNLRRNGWMTVAAVSSVTITLILVGIFLSLILNTTKLARDLENNVQVVAFMKVTVHDQSKTLPDPKNVTKTVPNPDYLKVYDAIKAIPNVKTITYSDRTAEYNKLTQWLPEYKSMAGDGNPLRDIYTVDADKPSDLKAIDNAIKGITGIDDTNYGGANADKIFSLSNVIQNWGLGFAALLILVAVFLISNTIRITILSRQREIQIMRLVGAKNGYIRWPFFLEGAWVGLLGAVIPAFLVSFLYSIAYNGINNALLSSRMSLIPAGNFIPQITVLLFAVGIIIGALGSLISMRRFLKA